jgi:electron transfer flavoprotein beta subunit
VMPALQKAKPSPLKHENLGLGAVALPKQKRDTRVVKDVPLEEMATEIVAWIKG